MKLYILVKWNNGIVHNGMRIAWFLFVTFLILLFCTSERREKYTREQQQSNLCKNAFFSHSLYLLSFSFSAFYCIFTSYFSVWGHNALKKGISVPLGMHSFVEDKQHLPTTIIRMKLFSTLWTKNVFEKKNISVFSANLLAVKQMNVKILFVSEWLIRAVIYIIFFFIQKEILNVFPLK